MMATGDFMYSPTASLTDSPVHNPIADGVAWVEGAALGSVATSVAVVAVAAIGLLMLSGRSELRRGITVVLGCFLLLGASAIGRAITSWKSAEVMPRAPGAPAPSQMTSILSAQEDRKSTRLNSSH